ncbi:hypothetical protein [Mesobacterium pallidum]|uniref:hypothetical protein n=1 Tax=Mesobacterium pallidum TaxID=2872037 RepID=UPI001EE25F93|nr:hypothetical protein [Mesobacterium pallidum]
MKQERFPSRFARLTASEFDMQQKRAREQIYSKLEEHRSEDVILSAEDFGNLSEDELDSFVKSIQHHEIHTYCYIRDPIGYAPSAFQQRVKAGVLRDWNIGALVPQYSKLRKFLTLKHCELLRYDKSSLKNGCVVQDFCGRIGVDIHPNEIKYENESISFLAISLLYCRNKARAHEGFRTNNPLLPTLKTLKGPKVSFSPRLIKEMLQRRQNEISQMQNFLGRPWQPERTLKRPNVRGESDLLEPPADARNWLACRVASYDGSPDYRAVGKAMDELENIVIERSKSRKSGILTKDHSHRGNSNSGP